VLCCGLVDGGLAFYTNYESQKGQELAANDQAEGLFSWLQLERQVRISGRVHPLSDAALDEYFNQRPLASRLASLAPNQSREITDRSVLESC